MEVKWKIENLRPICRQCNLTMKCETMTEFMKFNGFDKLPHPADKIATLMSKSQMNSTPIENTTKLNVNTVCDGDLSKIELQLLWEKDFGERWSGICYDCDVSIYPFTCFCHENDQFEKVLCCSKCYTTAKNVKFEKKGIQLYNVKIWIMFNRMKYTALCFCCGQNKIKILGNWFLVNFRPVCAQCVRCGKMTLEKAQEIHKSQLIPHVGDNELSSETVQCYINEEMLK
jgi:hypothetical protein